MTKRVYFDTFLRKEFSIFGFKIPYKKRVRYIVNIPESGKYTLKDLIEGKLPPSFPKPPFIAKDEDFDKE